MFEGLPDDMQPRDDESQDEWLHRMFPEAPDNTVAWLCHCLSQSQMALVIAMMELNKSESDVDDGSYNQRIQRVLHASELNDRQGTEQALVWARKFAKENQLW